MYGSSRIRLSLNAVFAVYALAVVSFFWEIPYYLTGMIFLASVAMLLLRKNTEEYVLFLVGSLMGSVAEIVAISYGAWNYSRPQFLGIPVWLPFLWGMASIFIERISSDIHQYASEHRWD